MPAWRNGIRACLKNKSPQGVEGSNPSTGMTRPLMSTIVFHVLYRPIGILVGSTGISCYLLCLLSVLLSGPGLENVGGDAICSIWP
jgi:hypothetical protein